MIPLQSSGNWKHCLSHGFATWLLPASPCTPMVQSILKALERTHETCKCPSTSRELAIQPKASTYLSCPAGAHQLLRLPSRHLPAAAHSRGPVTQDVILSSGFQANQQTASNHKPKYACRYFARRQKLLLHNLGNTRCRPSGLITGHNHAPQNKSHSQQLLAATSMGL